MPINTTKLLKIWGVFTIILIAVVLYLVLSKKILVAPDPVFVNTNDPKVEKTIDSLEKIIVYRESKIESLSKQQQKLKEEYEILKKIYDDTKIKIDSVTEFTGNATKLLSELSNIAETPRQ